MIEVISEAPWEELAARIRAVHLLQLRDGQQVYPYAHAQISLEEIPYDSVRPTSLYALAGHLAFQRRLADDLAQQGYDPLRLAGMLMLKPEGQNSTGLIPPIVEQSDEDGRYVLDGLHRSYTGWAHGRAAFTAVLIRGIRQDCPAAARPNEWEEVVVYESVPEDARLKRRYRTEDYLSLRRDFSALNGSAPRN